MCLLYWFVCVGVGSGRRACFGLLLRCRTLSFAACLQICQQDIRSAFGCILVCFGSRRLVRLRRRLFRCSWCCLSLSPLPICCHSAGLQLKESIWSGTSSILIFECIRAHSLALGFVSVSPASPARSGFAFGVLCALAGFPVPILGLIRSFGLKSHHFGHSCSSAHLATKVQSGGRTWELCQPAAELLLPPLCFVSSFPPLCPCVVG